MKTYSTTSAKITRDVTKYFYRISNISNKAKQTNIFGHLFKVKPT